MQAITQEENVDKYCNLIIMCRELLRIIKSSYNSMIDYVIYNQVADVLTKNC